MPLNEKHFALTGGIMWGICILITTAMSLLTGYGSSFLNAMAGIYPGYSISALGLGIGFVYGFIDGFIGLYIFAWLYNRLGKSFPSRDEHKTA